MELDVFLADDLRQFRRTEVDYRAKLMLLQNRWRALGILASGFPSPTISDERWPGPKSCGKPDRAPRLQTGGLHVGDHLYQRRDSHPAQLCQVSQRDVVGQIAGQAHQASRFIVAGLGHRSGVTTVRRPLSGMRLLHGMLRSGVGDG